ncbi:60S ribosomal protein L21A [Maublancomyces gigas]|uniref:60S ribosomal protein L21A n=1 Tax=Discina gigas TaxID=1032678 RepID=A0ABR3GH54_9PEZI
MSTLKSQWYSQTRGLKGTTRDLYSGTVSTSIVPAELLERETGHSGGIRSGTRYAFSRDFRKKGMIPLSTYLKVYRVGDIVDIKANGAVQKGMPHKVYHGKTGVVYNVTRSALGVIIYKKVGNRYLEKRVNVRIEHVNHSKCRTEFVNRVKDNAAKKIKAKTEGTHIHLKRQPVQPREDRIVSAKSNLPETIVPIPYETTI